MVKLSKSKVIYLLKFEKLVNKYLVTKVFLWGGVFY